MAHKVMGPVPISLRISPSLTAPCKLPNRAKIKKHQFYTPNKIENKTKNKNKIENKNKNKNKNKKNENENENKNKNKNKI
jgi:hypothetical protein